MPVRTQQPDSDDGFTLVEVIVAMLVFTIILTGLVYTMTASMTATRDTRSRVVAANLASQQIDVLRSTANAFSVTGTSHDYTAQLNGDTFHVDVETEWVDNSGAVASCEAGAAVDSLAYNHLTVKVTWDSMLEGAQPVYSDTSITPRTKINDQNLGTVLVGVVNAAGTAVSAATVSLSAAAGVAAVTTDGNGCAYLLKVPPGTYTVTVTKAGYVSDQQQGSPTATVVVTAGDSSRTSFAYDRATSYQVAYAPNVSSAANIPNNLSTSFVSSYGSFRMPSSTPGKTKTFMLYPISSGYSVLAGDYAETPENASTNCLATDPGQWAAGAGTIGVRPDAVAGTPGSVVAAAAQMGEVRLSGANGSGSYLKAVHVGGGSGEPDCGAGMAYTFGSVIGGGTTSIALPYGSWRLYRGNATSQTTLITSGISVFSTGSVSGDIVTLDPRVTG